LVSNLLKNAFIHSFDNGIFFVIINSDKLVFCNSGKDSLDKELIFKRFYSAGNKENSSGLGLAIVESICKNYSLKIDYEFKNSNHFFTVKKP
jgi:signal transduction histidine kinase